MFSRIVRNATRNAVLGQGDGRRGVRRVIRRALYMGLTTRRQSVKPGWVKTKEK